MYSEQEQAIVDYIHKKGDIDELFSHVIMEYFMLIIEEQLIKREKFKDVKCDRLIKIKSYALADVPFLIYAVIASRDF